MKALIQTRFILKESIGETLILWVRSCSLEIILLLLPIACLFFSVQVAMMQPAIYTNYFPLLSLFSLGFTLLFRTFGLTLVYLSLLGLLWYSYPELKMEENLWQMMLLLSLALNCFILLLAVENVEGKEEMVALKREQEEERGKYQIYIDSLRELVQELTQELEQRRIDKVDGRWEEEKRAHGQLRRQFEEKSALLSATREQLFSVETALLAKERTEKELLDLSTLTREYEQQCIDMSEEQIMLESEISLLQEIIRLRA